MVSNPIAAHFADEPSYVAPEAAERFKVCVERAGATLLDIEAKEAASEQASTDFWDPDEWYARYRPYNVVDGILRVPVQGVLVARSSFATSYFTGYKYVSEAIKRGLDDSNVEGIALVVDSPGGMVSGLFELVEEIGAAREEKRIEAFAADSAYSAAYAIASAASKITVTRSGGVGSIGVITTHVSYAKLNERVGIEVTYIYAGKHKADGNSDEPLSDQARKRIQERIDALYSEFVSSVARYRGMDEKAVRDTEALTFTAQEALSKGLADAVGSLDDAVAAFAAKVSTQKGDINMSVNKDEPAVDTAAIDAAREAGRQEGHAAGLTEGAAAERTRIRTILDSENAKTRQKAALSLALKSGMDADAVNEILGDLDEDAAAQAPAMRDAQSQPNAFENAMNNSDNPDIANGEDAGDSAVDGSADVALARRLGVPGFKQAQ